MEFKFKKYSPAGQLERMPSRECRPPAKAPASKPNGYTAFNEYQKAKLEIKENSTFSKPGALQKALDRALTLKVGLTDDKTKEGLTESYAEFANATIQYHDSNGDGVLSAEEYQKNGIDVNKTYTDAIDYNKNGNLELSEMTALTALYDSKGVNTGIDKPEGALKNTNATSKAVSLSMANSPNRPYVLEDLNELNEYFKDNMPEKVRTAEECGTKVDKPQQTTWGKIKSYFLGE